MRSGEFEANMLGSWFARIGAFAIFLGAAFAFKYAVDRNLISPAGRVAIGVLLGGAFIGWGEWARRKTWPLFAQAVAGGGVAIMYLSVWAGYQLYDLMSPMLALVFLAAVVALGGVLAVRHNSMALAIMAALGGFLNPVLVTTGRGSNAALYLYLLFLNAGILGLAFYKHWRALTVVAMAATWLLVLGSIFDITQSERAAALAFGTVFFLMFTAALLTQYLKTESSVQPEDLVLTSINALVFFAFGMLILPEGAQPPFALLLGLAHMGLGIAWRSRNRADATAVLTFIALGVGAATTAVALQFEGPVLSTVWAVEAVLIMIGSVRVRLSKLRVAGLIVFSLSLMLSLFGSGLGVLYHPPRLFFSVDALPFVTQIAALSGTSVFLRRKGETALEQRAADTSMILALLLALLWLTFEVGAQYQRAGWSLRTLPFAVATLWALYGAGIGIFGLFHSLKWPRPLAIAIFGLSLAISLLFTGFGTTYEPFRAVLSVESSPFLVQIAVLGSAAIVLRRRSDSRAADVAAVGGNLLALVWVTFELLAQYERAGWRISTLPFVLATYWALHAAAMGSFGLTRKVSWTKPMATAVFGLSLGTSLLSSGLGTAYEPSRPVLSPESSAFLVQIAILAAAALALRRTAGATRSRLVDAIAVGANLLTVLWLTFELWAWYNRPSAGWGFATFTFTLSTLWTLYAAGLLAFGIAVRAKWARLFSVSLFGLVIMKLVLADVWLLETPLRIASLMGLGLVLLLCSLGYHRFRALILGPDDPASPASSGVNAA